jgi:transcriptional regulator with XRE-family HTH domain
MPDAGESDDDELTPERRVGVAMKAARENKGLSCRALAGKLHMAHSNLSDYENGRRLAPEHILEAYEAELELRAGHLVELRQPAADEVYGKMRHRRRRRPASGGSLTGTTAGRWSRGHSTRRIAIISIAFALVALGSVLALAGFHNGARVPAATKGSCASLRQYRVVTGGNVLAAGGEVIATVVAGDLFDAATTHGTPYYAHRYYGTVLRTGVWGYVDSKKLQFVKDTCFP